MYQVVEQLVVRKRLVHYEHANILTLGYREETPMASGHRVTQSNRIVCYYPNTLVAALKQPLWASLHKLMGDDLMMHLLLYYTILVQPEECPKAYVQVDAVLELKNALDKCGTKVL